MAGVIDILLATIQKFALAISFARMLPIHSRQTRLTSTGACGSTHKPPATSSGSVRAILDADESTTAENFSRRTILNLMRSVLRRGDVHDPKTFRERLALTAVH